MIRIFSTHFVQWTSPSGTEKKRSDFQRGKQGDHGKIDYNTLLLDSLHGRDTHMEILEIIIDTVCTTKPTIRISSDNKSVEVVRSQFLKLDSEHIKPEALRAFIDQVRCSFGFSWTLDECSGYKIPTAIFAAWQTKGSITSAS